MRSPNDLNAEQAVLACVVLKPSLAGDVFARLSSDEAFHDRRNQAVAAALRSMCTTSTRPGDLDEVTIGAVVEQLGLLGNFNRGGREQLQAYVREMVQAVPGVTGTDGYVAIVHERWVRRAWQTHCLQSAEAAGDYAVPLPDTLLAAQQMSVRMAGMAAEKRTVSLAEAAQDLQEDVAQRQADRLERAGQQMGLPTGVPGVDELMGCIGESSMFLIGGNPGEGKSTILLQMADAVASTAGQRHPDGRGGALIVSLEMLARDLAGKLLFGAAKLDGRKVRLGDVSDDDFQALSEAAYKCRDKRLYIDEMLHATWPQVRSRIILAVAELGVEAVFLDYIQNVEQDKAQRFQKKHEHFAAVSKGVKDLTRELRIPIVCAARLKRGERFRKGKRPPRPMLSDLGESSSLEYDADDVMMIWPGEPKLSGTIIQRPGDWVRVPATLIVAKSRLGATGDLEVVFNKSLALFEPPYGPDELVFVGAGPTTYATGGLIDPEKE